MTFLPVTCLRNVLPWWHEMKWSVPSCQHDQAQLLRLLHLQPRPLLSLLQGGADQPAPAAALHLALLLHQVFTNSPVNLSLRVTILPVFRFWEESETLTFCCHVNFSSSSSFILWLLTLCWCWHHWLSAIDVYKKYFCCTLNTLLKLLIWIVSPQLALVSECV